MPLVIQRSDIDGNVLAFTLKQYKKFQAKKIEEWEPEDNDDDSDEQEQSGDEGEDEEEVSLSLYWTQG